MYLRTLQGGLKCYVNMYAKLIVMMELDVCMHVCMYVFMYINKNAGKDTAYKGMRHASCFQKKEKGGEKKKLKINVHRCTS